MNLLVRTPLPEDQEKYRGEYRVAKTLTEFKDLDGEVWFQINNLATVPELDLLFFHKNAGLYLIEIKSVTLDYIVEYTTDTYKTKSQYRDQHPVSQVKHGSIKLREYLQRVIGEEKRKNTQVPFLQNTVLWPLITRKEWRERFTDPNVRIQSESFLFKDDLANGRLFIDGLQRLWTRPLGGAHAPQNARGEHIGMDLVREVCSRKIGRAHV